MIGLGVQVLSLFWSLELKYVERERSQTKGQVRCQSVLVPGTAITAGTTIQEPGTLYYPAITVTLGHPLLIISFINPWTSHVSVLFYASASSSLLCLLTL